MRRYPGLINATEQVHSDTYLGNRPGTLTLRSTFCMPYDPKVLTDEWYEFRLSQPLDFDYKREGSLHRSSYRSIWFGDPNSPLPISTAHAMMEETLDSWRKKKLARLPYFNIDNFNKTALAEKGLPDKFPSLKTTLHMTEKRPLPESVTTADYKFPLHLRKPTKPLASKIPDLPWMKCRLVHSQFTDLDGPKHKGIHTWQVENCKYSHYRYRSKESSTDIILHPEDPRVNRQ